MTLLGIGLMFAGIMIVGFALLTLGNPLNLGYTRHQREHADNTNSGTILFWAKVGAGGLAVIGAGFGIAALGSA